MVRHGLTIIGLLGLTGLVFHPILFHDFINFDTGFYIYNNPYVRTGLTLDNIAWAFTTVHVYNWHPLTWISHMIDVSIFGLDPAGHLGVNLAFHVLNTGLLYAFLYLTTRDHGSAAIVAALFAIHPMHVESVAWVAERKDVLSTALLLTTLLLWRKWTLNPSVFGYALVCVTFALGALAKPMVVTLPFVLLLLDYWPLNRFEGHTRFPTWVSRLLVLTREKIPLFVIAAGTMVITLYAQRSGGSLISGSALDLGQRLANAIVSYTTYLGKAFIPSDLAIFYPHPLFHPPLTIAAALAILAAISLGTLVFIRRMPWLFVGWAMFLGTLVPVIGIVQVGGQAYADRYTYVPYIGLFIALVFGGRALFQRIDVNPAILRTGVAGLIAVYALSAYQYVGHFKNSLRLWQHTLLVTDSSYERLIGLEAGQAARGAAPKAMQEPSRGIVREAGGSKRLKGLYIPYYNMGRALQDVGLYRDALIHYDQALTLNPNAESAWYQRGNTLLALGREQEALEAFDQVETLVPDDERAMTKIAAIRRQLQARKDGNE